MRLSKFTQIIALIMLCLLVVSCNAQTPVENSSAEPETQNQSNPETAVPAPGEDQGVLTGTLLQKGVDGNPDIAL